MLLVAFRKSTKFSNCSRIPTKIPCSIREGGKPHGIKIVILGEKEKQSELIFKDGRTRAEREIEALFW